MFLKSVSLVHSVVAMLSLLVWFGAVFAGLVASWRGFPLRGSSPLRLAAVWPYQKAKQNVFFHVSGLFLYIQ